ncbi:tyrosine-protein kinase SRK2-like [Argonauta hians]
MGSCLTKFFHTPNSSGEMPLPRVTDDGLTKSQSSVGQRELPNPPCPDSGVFIVRALYDFDAITDEDLTFKKGDRMIIEDKDQSNDWWVARHIVSNVKGYIPSNYVIKDVDSLQAQDWWHDLERKDAEIQLLLPGNTPGTFLIRHATDQRSLVLSIRDVEISSNRPAVRHYRLRSLDNGGYFITPRQVFNNVFDLINYYSSNNEGLCQRLQRICPKDPPIVHFRELEVDRESVTLLNKIDSGCFGEVYLGKWNNSVNVAIKTLKAGTMSPDDFVMEARTMHTLRHRRLVQLLAVCTQGEPIYIITEFMSNGSLLSYLRNNKNTPQPPTLVHLTEIAAQVSDGMKYLESQQYVHRDLRAANILVAANYTVKVADFGLARLIMDGVYQAQVHTRFPIKWTAPEAAREHRFSVKSDVWSFGVLLYEIITFGRVPYPEYPGRTVLDRIDQGYRMPKPMEPIVCPDPYYDIMKECWQKKPDKRPTFDYLFSFFNDFSVTSEQNYHE